MQILYSLKNNVIDPLEKFSSIEDSINSKNYLNDTENNISESINDDKKYLNSSINKSNDINGS